jgi:hypothetical protein
MGKGRLTKTQGDELDQRLMPGARVQVDGIDKGAVDVEDRGFWAFVILGHYAGQLSTGQMGQPIFNPHSPDDAVICCDLSAIQIE